MAYTKEEIKRERERRNRLKSGMPQEEPPDESLEDDDSIQSNLNRYTHDGKISVTDGPYSESQEILGGFFMIEAVDYGEAVEIARTCPHLGEGKWIEVRQVDQVHQ